MQLFFPSINLTDEEWRNLTIQYLCGWTEIPLTIYSGYDIDLLKFYDGFFGYLLKRTEELYTESAEFVNNRQFFKAWKYQGKIYRVLHKVTVEDDKAEDGYRCVFPTVEYHGMITHWTDDFTFKGLMYKLSSNEPYIILEANTGTHFGFDVNKFRKTYNVENKYTQKEREIIFPMYKECITEYRMTISEFIKLKEENMK